MVTLESQHCLSYEWDNFFVSRTCLQCIQEFVPAIELLEYGFPVSSPFGVEPAGSSASGAASSHHSTNSLHNFSDLVQKQSPFAHPKPKGIGQAHPFRFLDPKNCNNSFEVGTKLAQNCADLVQNELIEPGFSASSSSSLFPEPVCNAIQEFVPAIELLEFGFPVSSPSGDEHSGASASSAATTTIT